MIMYFMAQSLRPAPGAGAGLRSERPAWFPTAAAKIFSARLCSRVVRYRQLGREAWSAVESSTREAAVSGRLGVIDFGAIGMSAVALVPGLLGVVAYDHRDLRVRA
jgi:hypothetical protein